MFVGGGGRASQRSAEMGVIGRDGWGDRQRWDGPGGGGGRDLQWGGGGGGAVIGSGRGGGGSAAAAGGWGKGRSALGGGGICSGRGGDRRRGKERHGHGDGGPRLPEMTEEVT